MKLHIRSLHTIASILLICITLAGCNHKKNKQEVETVVLDEQTISTFATDIINGLHNGNAAALNDVIDKENIRKLISENSIVYSGLDVDGGQAYFDKCLQLGDQALLAINNGGDYTFVKYYVQNDEHHIIMRSYDNFNLNFQDFIIDTVQGKLKIKDGFIYNLGCNLSESIKYSMLYNLMLQTNPESDVKWLQQAEELTLNGKHAQAISILSEHKDAIKEYPLFYQLWIANQYQSDATHFIAHLNELKNDIDERYFLLHSLLYYFNEGKLAETEQTINQLIPHSGDDPIYLLFYGKANYYSKQYDDALTIFKTAEKSMPLLWDLWYGELQCLKQLKDDAEYQKCLQKGKEAYGMSEQELQSLKIK